MGKRIELLDPVRPLIEERRAYEGRKQVHDMAAQIQGRGGDPATAIDYLEGLVILLKAENKALRMLLEDVQKNLYRLRIGDEVHWSDPDGGTSSGTYEILSIKGEVLVLKNEKGSVVEVLEHEIRRV